MTAMTKNYFSKLIYILFMLYQMGCAHQVASFLGVGEPVSKERCEKLDMHQMGFDDGKLGQRKGDKYDFWVKDCRQADIKLDKSVYDQGYQEGLQVYCGCENGYLTGVKDQYLELKGQYYNCDKEKYKAFISAYEEGKKQKENPEWVVKGPKFEVSYKEELILEAAKKVCADGKSSVVTPESNSK